MLDDRKLDVLRAIVEDYVDSREPVGSKALVERHRLGVSSATVRNDMAVLEEAGLITQPHTSAGRVPTDAGYRLFVDRLTTVRPLSRAEKRAITTFLHSAVDPDDVVRRTVRLLAQLTRQVAIVQYPSVGRGTVRHVELVALAPTRLLVVLITSNGRVEQRMVDTGVDLAEELVAELRARLNAGVVGHQLADAPGRLSELAEAFPPEDRTGVSLVLAALADVANEATDERVAIGGTAYLARYGDDFNHSVEPVLEALEEHVVLLRLLGEAANPPAVTVRIGHENTVRELSGASVVSAGYGPGEEALATLGVVGPTRMDYPGTIGTVRAVSRYVSRILAGS